MISVELPDFRPLTFDLPRPFCSTRPLKPDMSVMATDILTILKLTVPLIVKVGDTHLSFDDILSLGPGAIVELDCSSENELDLLVNNKPIGKGVAVKVGENFGIRISTIGSPEERIAAMGGEGGMSNDE